MRKKLTHTSFRMCLYGCACVCVYECGVTMCKIQRAKSRTQTISQHSQSAPSAPLLPFAHSPLCQSVSGAWSSVDWRRDATMVTLEFEWRFRRKQNQS